MESIGAGRHQSQVVHAASRRLAVGIDKTISSGRRTKFIGHRQSPRKLAAPPSTFAGGGIDNTFILYR